MKNQFEEVLFKVEDEMYNMDFELGNLKRAMDVFAKEKNAIEEMTEEQKA